MFKKLREKVEGSRAAQLGVGAIVTGVAFVILVTAFNLFGFV